MRTLRKCAGQLARVETSELAAVVSRALVPEDGSVDIHLGDGATVEHLVDQVRAASLGGAPWAWIVIGAAGEAKEPLEIFVGDRIVFEAVVVGGGPELPAGIVAGPATRREINWYDAGTRRIASLQFFDRAAVSSAVDAAWNPASGSAARALAHAKRLSAEYTLVALGIPSAGAVEPADPINVFRYRPSAPEVRTLVPQDDLQIELVPWRALDGAAGALLEQLAPETWRIGRARDVPAPDEPALRWRAPGAQSFRRFYGGELPGLVFARRLTIVPALISDDAWVDERHVVDPGGDVLRVEDGWLLTTVAHLSGLAARRADDAPQLDAVRAAIAGEPLTEEALGLYLDYFLRRRVLHQSAISLLPVAIRW